MGQPLPDPRVLPSSSHLDPAALDAFGDIHRQENPSDESRHKLPGRPPNLEVPQCRYVLPRGGLEPETFKHAIFSCPSRQHVRSGLLHCVTDAGHEAPFWTSFQLRKRLANLISVTSMGFPPRMFPPTTPPSSPLLPLSPSRVPLPVFRLLSLAEVYGHWVYHSCNLCGLSFLDS